MARAPRLDGTQEHFTDQQAAELTQAASAAVAKWHDKRAGTARAFIEMCARVAAFTDASVKPTKSQDKAFWIALGDPSNFTKSAWRTIGEHAAALAPHAAHLPTAQEAIKELARAEKKQRGAIAKLMSSGLNENSSVADVRKAVRPYLGDIDDQPTSNEHSALLRATKIEQVVAIIKQALTANDAITISFTDDKVLADKVIASLGKWSADTGNAQRLMIDGEFPHNPLAGFVVSGKMSRLERLAEDYQSRLWKVERDTAKNAIEAARNKHNRKVAARIKREHKITENNTLYKTLFLKYGWGEDTISFSNDNKSPGDWIREAADCGFIKAKDVYDAVEKAVAKVKEPKALGALTAEHDTLVAASPKQPESPVLKITSSSLLKDLRERMKGGGKGKITF